ncbi:Palmitoyl-protein thioesterase 1 [Gurleya vavrai]
MDENNNPSTADDMNNRNSLVNAIKVSSYIITCKRKSIEIDNNFLKCKFHFSNDNLTLDAKVIEINSFLIEKFFNCAKMEFERFRYDYCIDYCKKIIKLVDSKEAKKMLCLAKAKMGYLYDAKKFQAEQNFNIIKNNCFKHLEYDIDTEIGKYMFNHNFFDNFTEEFVIDSKFFNYILRAFLLEKKITSGALYVILKTGYNLMVNLDNISYIDTEKEVYVFGGTSGQFFDVFGFLKNINSFEYNFEKVFRLDERKIFVFNGDLVGNGPYQIQNYIFLLLLKILHPQNIFLNRGKSEFMEEKSEYASSFMNELNKNYYSCESDKKHNYFESMLFYAFNLTFSMHPIATIINRKTFVANGGLPKENQTLDAINKLNRKVLSYSNDNSLHEIVDSEPSNTSNIDSQYKNNKNSFFDNNITNRFFETNGIKLMIRSQKTDDFGLQKDHDGSILTIKSAHYYSFIKKDEAIMIKIHSKGENKIRDGPNYSVVKFDEYSKENVKKLNGYESTLENIFEYIYK